MSKAEKSSDDQRDIPPSDVALELLVASGMLDFIRFVKALPPSLGPVEPLEKPNKT